MGASAFVMAHNHPSGSLEPSEADIVLTKQIQMNAKVLTISLLDHLIITSQGYSSFKVKGLL